MERGGLVYLDTTTVLWLYAGLHEKLTAPARAAVEMGMLRVSPTVTVEIAYLREKGRFAHDPEEVVKRLGENIGVALCDIPLSKVAEAALRIDWTKHVFERLIVAHALCQQASLVTANPNIRKHYERAIW